MAGRAAAPAAPQAQAPARAEAPAAEAAPAEAPKAEAAHAACEDAVTGEPVGPVFRHGGSVMGVAFSPDSRRLITASRDRTAQMWAVPGGTPIAPPINCDQGLMGVSFSADGARVLVHTLKAAQIFDEIGRAHV